MKSYLLLFLFSLGSFYAIPQERETTINDLKEKIKKANTDSLRIKLKFDLVEIYGKRYDLRAREEAQNLIIDILNTIEKNKWESPIFQRMKAESLQNMATFKIDEDKVVEALQWQQKAIDYSTIIKDTLVTGAGYYVLGRIYGERNDTINEKLSLKKSIATLEQLKTKEGKIFLAQSLNQLANFYNFQKKIDSAKVLYKRVATLDNGRYASSIKSNLGSIYLKEKNFKQALPLFKESLRLKSKLDLKGKSVVYYQMSKAYRGLREYDKAIKLVDSAIYYQKLARSNGTPRDLVAYYSLKVMLLRKAGRNDQLYENFRLFNAYKDTLNTLKDKKRIKEIELKYQFEKEKEITAIQLKNANSKKKLYIVLFIISILLGLIIIYLILKSKRQKLALARNEVATEQIEKMKAKLALANRESELKKVLVESSITEEVLNKTLDDIKEIIVNKDSLERERGLRSLSASLLSEKSAQKAAVSLQEYIDKVSVDFKVHLDTNYPMLGASDKELLYLMKVGLNATEISKLLKTSISSVKSKRYRMRKKLNLGSEVDIIAHLEKQMTR